MCPPCLPAAAACDSCLQADVARATARDAFRADQRNEAKSADWHNKVAAAQQVAPAGGGDWENLLAAAACAAWTGRAAAGPPPLSGLPCCPHLPPASCCPGVQSHEVLREARETLYSLQALAELQSRELQRRRGAAGGGGNAAAAVAAAAEGGTAAALVEEQLLVPPAPQGTKRKRGAPHEPCPFCGHGYTGVRLCGCSAGGARAAAHAPSGRASAVGHCLAPCHIVALTSLTFAPLYFACSARRAVKPRGHLRQPPAPAALPVPQEDAALQKLPRVQAAPGRDGAGRGRSRRL